MKTPNYVWYFLLIGISLFVLMITLMKHKDKKRLLQTYFFITGLAYIVDYIVLVLLDAYYYKPLLVNSYWFDNILGSIVSQGITIPTSAVAIAEFHFRLTNILMITLSILGIEWFFLNMDLYEHHWWKIWITGILLPICFYIAKGWYQLLKRPGPFVKFFTMYLTIAVYINTLHFILLFLFSVPTYSVHWFNDPIRDSLTFNALYIFCFSFFFTFLISFKFQWRWITAILSIKILFDFLCIKYNLLMNSYSTIFLFLVLHVSTILIFRYLYVKWFIP
ncbi:hypothetical protein [Bacillus andreraoultii]|uniref:hypothetical protein n=1 Tax=Bacillus andreraoultii TaxID=1499685 RepID=UPI0005398DDF|nr:hypothetical protein [Bacillus andreraoultii]